MCDGEQQRQQWADGQHDRADPGRHLLQRPVETPVRGRERQQSVDHHQAEHAPARQRQPQRGAEHAEDHRRETEAKTRAPQRVELAIAVPHRDEVAATDQHRADERAERQPIGRRL